MNATRPAANALDWQDQLVELYCLLCTEYRTELWTHVQRLSPNAHPAFTDEEVLTVYLYGLLQQLRTLQAIHTYTRRHLRAWFPALPSYQAFSHRLTNLDALLPALVQALLERLPAPLPSSTHLLDSLPIVLAQGVRAKQARVAPEAADMGYCASKRRYYYGVKLHALAVHAPRTMPRAEQLMVSAASANDLAVAKSYTHALPPGELYADKCYQDSAWQQDLQQQALVLRTPIRRVRNQAPLDSAERLYGTAISRVRQPIESFFAWLEAMTGIQIASRVRSTAGLWVHIFGRLAAAMLMLYFNS